MLWVWATLGAVVFVPVVIAGLIGPRPGMPWSLPSPPSAPDEAGKKGKKA